MCMGVCVHARSMLNLGEYTSVDQEQLLPSLSVSVLLFQNPAEWANFCCEYWK